ncbi:hypothetical protein ABGT25_24190, partial [Pseudomonas juntendi]
EFAGRLQITLQKLHTGASEVVKMVDNQIEEFPREIQEAAEQAVAVAGIEVRDMCAALYREIVVAVANSRRQEKLERIALGIARAKALGKYKGRQPNKLLHQRILECLNSGKTIRRTAKEVNCAKSTVQRVKDAHGLEIKTPSSTTVEPKQDKVSAGLRALGHY